MKKIIVFILPAFFLLSCNSTGLYEQTKVLGNQEWSSKDKFSFNFSVKDSIAFYNIYLVIRHNDTYNYNNIWVNYTFMPPGAAPVTDKLEIVLGDAKGWLGSSMDDITEQRMQINKNPVRLKPGNYTFVLQQIMREDPLKGLLNVGIRVEKLVQ